MIERREVGTFPKSQVQRELWSHDSCMGAIHGYLHMVSRNLKLSLL